VDEFRKAVEARQSGEIDVYGDSPDLVATTISDGWVVIDGRGKTCAGVIAAISRQTAADSKSFIEAILADALNIYDVIVWAEGEGHKLITKRVDADGSTRVLLEPFTGK
jgi:formylmethanofuran dehydrogenase subunit C